MQVLPRMLTLALLATGISAMPRRDDFSDYSDDLNEASTGLAIGRANPFTSPRAIPALASSLISKALSSSAPDNSAVIISVKEALEKAFNEILCVVGKARSFLLSKPREELSDSDDNETFSDDAQGVIDQAKASISTEISNLLRAVLNVLDDLSAEDIALLSPIIANVNQQLTALLLPVAPVTVTAAIMAQVLGIVNSIIPSAATQFSATLEAAKSTIRKLFNDFSDAINRIVADAINSISNLSADAFDSGQQSTLEKYIQAVLLELEKLQSQLRSIYDEVAGAIDLSIGGPESFAGGFGNNFLTATNVISSLSNPPRL